MNIKYYDPQDFPKYLPKLNALYDDLFSRGKGFRSQLVGVLAKHLEIPEKTHLLLAQTIEFIHNASLLHDDLVDRSHLRRNKPTAWLKYTPEYAVLAGDYLLARVMVNLSSHGNVKLIHYTSQVISNLLEGEWIQDSLINDWSVNLSKLDMVHNRKTASLFKWCLRAPFLAIEDYDEEIQDLLESSGSSLGLLFQRSDDLLDFDIRNYEGKALLGDLKSGYLNSFGAYLLEELKQKQIESFKNSKNIEDVWQAVGREYFDKRLKDFDLKNEETIKLYQHYLTQIQNRRPHLKALIDELRPLSNWLYWRTKDGGQ
jgi:octaprenyl-diphosphate synthase